MTFCNQDIYGVGLGEYLDETGQSIHMLIHRKRAEITLLKRNLQQEINRDSTSYKATMIREKLLMKEDSLSRSLDWLRENRKKAHDYEKETLGDVLSPLEPDIQRLAYQIVQERELDYEEAVRHIKRLYFQLVLAS